MLIHAHPPPLAKAGQLASQLGGADVPLLGDVKLGVGRHARGHPIEGVLDKVNSLNTQYCGLQPVLTASNKLLIVPAPEPAIYIRAALALTLLPRPQQKPPLHQRPTLLSCTGLDDG
jgi:hypothetical protein